MNYYDHYIADYQSKTAHLSLAEHGAYLLMLQNFYASERPLPSDRKVLFRLLRADSKTERAAVESVIRQYWDEKEGGLLNKRALEVVTEYRAWVEKQRANGKRRLSDGSAKPQPSLSDGSAKGGDSIPTSHTTYHTTSHTKPAQPSLSDGGRKGGGLRQMAPERRAKTADELEREEAAREEGESVRKPLDAQMPGGRFANR